MQEKGISSEISCLGDYMQYRGHSQSNPIVDSFKFVAETQRQVQAVASKARAAVKAFYRNPDDLAIFIEKQGTPVYALKGGFRGLFIRLCLFFYGYDPGFIPPSQNGRFSVKRYEALRKVLLHFCGERPGCNFDKGVFVLPQKLFTVGYIAHQFHHWLACLAGLPGYSAAEQEEFRQFMINRKGVVGPEVEKMSEAQIVNLRHAIHREIEALKFIKDVTEEIFRPARQARYLNNGTANA